MNWKLAKTNDLELILSLYSQVFGEQLEPLVLECKKDEGYSIDYYLIQQKDGEIGGFAVFLGKGQEVELWYSGIIPAQRRKGGGHALLSLGLQEMAELGYSAMTVCTFNRWNIMLLLLIRHKFRIIGTEYSNRWNDLKITLKKEIAPKRELRYALTEQCNFKCLFCHNEGLGHEKRDERSTTEILDILSEAIRLGYTDITLTGGEPLYGDRHKKERLYEILAVLGSLSKPPAITMVTNGALLTDADISHLQRYPGSLKIHVSLHATDADSFAKVTQMPPELFSLVKQNIRCANAAGIKVKVNCVLLQGINHDRIFQAVEVAREMGAVAIKFVELMVLPDSASDFGMYYDSSAILSELEKIAQPTPSDIKRRHLFTLNADADFTIEVQKCTCALGCSHCRELRDRTFSSDMRYHPCMVRERNSFLINSSSDLSTILQQGNRIIDGYAYKYGDSSPTLVKQEQFIAGKREFFFKIDSADRFSKYLVQSGFALVEKKGFHLEYYRPRKRSAEWDNFERVLKIGWDFHDQSKANLIYTDHCYSSHTSFGLEVTTRYLDSKGPYTFESADLARCFLDRLDFESFLTEEFQLDILRNGTLDMSVSANAQSPTVCIAGNNEHIRDMLKAVAGYAGLFEPLGVPLEQYLLQ
jgi:GTP 3',8-cyclase